MLGALVLGLGVDLAIFCFLVERSGSRGSDHTRKKDATRNSHDDLA